MLQSQAFWGLNSVDELVVLNTNSVLWDASVAGIGVFGFGMIAVLAATAQAKKNPEGTFLKGLGWSACVGMVIFLLALLVNSTIIDPVMKLALSRDRVTFLYRSGAEVAFERGQVQSVREYTSLKSRVDHIAITSRNGRRVNFSVASRKQRAVAEAIASRLGLHPSGTDGLWILQEP